MNLRNLNPFRMFDRSNEVDYWRHEAEVARKRVADLEGGMISTPAMRNVTDAAYGRLARYAIEVRHLNRALQRRRRTLRNLRNANDRLKAAAMNLRLAQRLYMEARNNPLMSREEMDMLGGNVGAAAALMDVLLPRNYAERFTSEMALEQLARPERITPRHEFRATALNATGIPVQEGLSPGDLRSM